METSIYNVQIDKNPHIPSSHTNFRTFFVFCNQREELVDIVLAPSPKIAFDLTKKKYAFLKGRVIIRDIARIETCYNL